MTYLRFPIITKDSQVQPSAESSNDGFDLVSKRESLHVEVAELSAGIGVRESQLWKDFVVQRGKDGKKLTESLVPHRA